MDAPSTVDLLLDAVSRARTVADLAGSALRVCNRDLKELRRMATDEGATQLAERVLLDLRPLFSPGQHDVSILGAQPREILTDLERTALVGAIRVVEESGLHPVLAARVLALAMECVGTEVLDSCFAVAEVVVIEPGAAFPTGRFDPNEIIDDASVSSSLRSICDSLDEIEGLRIAGSVFGYYDVKLDYSVRPFSRFLSERVFRAEAPAVDLDLTNVEPLAGCPRGEGDACACAGPAPGLQVAIGHPNVDILELISERSRFADGKYFWIGPFGEDVVLEDGELTSVSAKYQFEQISRIIDIAARERADILVLPEYSATQELAGSISGRAGRDVPVIVAGSYHHEDAEGRSNVAEVFMGESAYASTFSHSKMIPFVFADAFTEDLLPRRQEIRILAAENARMAVCICRDLLDRHLVNVLVDAASRFVIVPSATPKVSPFVGAASWLASQAQAFVIVANGPMAWLVPTHLAHDDEQMSVEGIARRVVTRAQPEAGNELQALGLVRAFPARGVVGHPVEGRLATRLSAVGDSVESCTPGVTLCNLTHGCARFIPLDENAGIQSQSFFVSAPSQTPGDAVE